jgi:hypothetical protein
MYTASSSSATLCHAREPAPGAPPPGGVRLLDQVRQRIRFRHYSIRTEHSYVEWVRRYVLYHGKRHPRELGPREVEAFLTHLAVAGKVSASTQNQAKGALLFIYREVLEQQLPWLEGLWARKRGIACRLHSRGRRVARCCAACRGRPAWWPVCSTAAVCASWKRCGCG